MPSAFQVLSANFQEATDAIRDAISGLGIKVPEGIILTDMADLIAKHLMIRPTVQSGSAYVTTGLAAGGYGTDINVTFPEVFKNIPTVTATATGTYNGKSYSLVVRNIHATKVGFNAQVANNNNVPLSSIVVSWIATDTV